MGFLDGLFIDVIDYQITLLAITRHQGRSRCEDCLSIIEFLLTDQDLLKRYDSSTSPDPFFLDPNILDVIVRDVIQHTTRINNAL